MKKIGSLKLEQYEDGNYNVPAEFYETPESRYTPV